MGGASTGNWLPPARADTQTNGFPHLYLTFLPVQGSPSAYAKVTQSRYDQCADRVFAERSKNWQHADEESVPHLADVSEEQADALGLCVVHVS